MNRITEALKKGTVGELLVQLRLLEHKVQAAPPIKDTGNDLIAIRGEVFRAIQVKTTTKNSWSKGRLPKMYHVVAVVKFEYSAESFCLDESSIYLIPRNEVDKAPTNISRLQSFLMTRNHVNSLFPIKENYLQ